MTHVSSACHFWIRAKSISCCSATALMGERGGLVWAFDMFAIINTRTHSHMCLIQLGGHPSPLACVAYILVNAVLRKIYYFSKISAPPVTAKGFLRGANGSLREMAPIRSNSNSPEPWRMDRGEPSGCLKYLFAGIIGEYKQKTSAFNNCFCLVIPTTTTCYCCLWSSFSESHLREHCHHKCP